MQMLPTPSTRSATRTAVGVRAPGRLHLGFLDPAGTLGRRFGSIGIVIDEFETEIELGAASDRDTLHADTLHAQTQEARGELDRAAGCLQRLREHTGLREPLALRLRRTLPAHAGFGSGTQLALAIGRAFANWHGLAIDTTTLARWLGRGQRSGIGIAGFEQGGLLVDGGLGHAPGPAPMLARLAVPPSWRIVVVQDPSRRGLSGDDERRAIAALPALSRALAADLCHRVLMQILPGAAEGDLQSFAAGVNRVQQLLGDHFAPAQDDNAWTSRAVGRLMQWVGDTCGDDAAIGQSSWGPTAFAIVASQAAARSLVDSAHACGVVDAGISLRIVTARNHGAVAFDARAS
jgi:beta-RFAP synthase